MNTNNSEEGQSPVKKAYGTIFKSGTSVSALRDAALADRLFPQPASSDLIDLPGRSLAWKLFLCPTEPLQASSDVLPSLLLDSLRTSRKNYNSLLLERLRAPDGSYEEGFSLPGTVLTSQRVAKVGSNLEKNNPLSLHNENPWKEWFAAIDLRRTISQDVERTFPDIAFFRNRDVQQQLSHILFLYSVMNPDIGYRQGMHELLAPLYYAVFFDSCPEDSSDQKDADFAEMCSWTWVSADAWALFEAVMRGVSQWYEWRETPPKLAKSAASPLANHVNLDVPVGQANLRPYVAPIVEACNQIQSQYLRTCDPLLWSRMQEAGIEPQIYGIRWLRLLFTRELNMSDALRLWDGLFACDPSLELAQWICVAMLIRIRNELLPADYTGQLTVLLRYPTPPTTDTVPYHTTLLLRQALALQMAPTPAVGAQLVMENRSILNIPVDVPESAPAQRRREQGATRHRQTASTSRLAVDGTNNPFGHARQQSTQNMGLPEMIARGLLERGESLGINKTLMSAVSELRRNIPDLASSLTRTPNNQYPAFPLEDDRSPEDRPPWEPRSRDDYEREITHLRSNNKRVGTALNWIVDVLLQDESESQNPQHLQRRKREALESLSYVRDVLNGSVDEIEEERLVGEDQARRKRESSRKARAIQPRVAVNIPPPVAPAPGATSEQRTKHPQQTPVQLSKSPVHPSYSISPSRSAPSSNFGTLPRAPWTHTPSSFSGGLPAATLPRLPPPTSTGLRNDRGMHRRELSQEDPLGAL